MFDPVNPYVKVERGAQRRWEAKRHKRRPSLLPPVFLAHASCLSAGPSPAPPRVSVDCKVVHHRSPRLRLPSVVCLPGPLDLSDLGPTTHLDTLLHCPHSSILPIATSFHTTTSRCLTRHPTSAHCRFYSLECTKRHGVAVLDTFAQVIICVWPDYRTISVVAATRCLTPQVDIDQVLAAKEAELTAQEKLSVSPYAAVAASQLPSPKPAAAAMSS